MCVHVLAINLVLREATLYKKSTTDDFVSLGYLVKDFRHFCLWLRNTSLRVRVYFRLRGAGEHSRCLFGARVA